MLICAVYVRVARVKIPLYIIIKITKKYYADFTNKQRKIYDISLKMTTIS